MRKTPWFFPVSTFSLKETAAAPFPGKSIWRELNNSSTSPESSTIPSRMRPATPLISAINSSKSVEVLPSGSSCGTGENNLPSAEYCGTRLLSPPLWMTRIFLLLKSPVPSASAIARSTFNVAPPLPTRFPSGSGRIKNLVCDGSSFSSCLSAICA